MNSIQSFKVILKSLVWVLGIFLGLLLGTAIEKRFGPFEHIPYYGEILSIIICALLLVVIIFTVLKLLKLRKQ